MGRLETILPQVIRTEAYAAAGTSFVEELRRRGVAATATYVESVSIESQICAEGWDLEAGCMASDVGCSSTNEVFELAIYAPSGQVDETVAKIEKAVQEWPEGEIRQIEEDLDRRKAALKARCGA